MTSQGYCLLLEDSARRYSARAQSQRTAWLGAMEIMLSATENNIISGTAMDEALGTISAMRTIVDELAEVERHLDNLQMLMKREKYA